MDAGALFLDPVFLFWRQALLLESLDVAIGGSCLQMEKRSGNPLREGAFKLVGIASPATITLDTFCTVVVVKVICINTYTCPWVSVGCTIAESIEITK